MSSIALHKKAEVHEEAFKRSFALIEQGRHADAIEAFAEALSADPNHASSWCNLGIKSINQWGRSNLNS